ncbi:DUF2357 domain-containing protein [Neobacillus dielmonensis]|uniref:DUF2357 domain-containing protein n=1 Tax=Neobacillus dielmonensis TaxID=1347369 RepID=UPI0005A7B1CF|nr:DUF2357 domain-containing protein [Neobacillus dielmonensis]
MAIPSSGFEVIFLQKRGDQTVSIPVERFFTNEFDFYEKREEVYTEIKENIGAGLIFQSVQDEARLFLDGLETLPGRMLKIDPVAGEVYLSPSEKPVTLFDHTQEFYPLIPGFYRLEIHMEGHRYYSWVKVAPKQLDETQLQTMKEEVEKEWSGLARDMIFHTTGLHAGLEGIPQGLLKQFMIINNHFSSTLAALSDLYRKVNYQIRKDYRLSSRDKYLAIDEKTIRHIVSHPEDEHVLLTPVSVVNYDLPENRLLKKIIESVSHTLRNFNDAVEKVEKHNSNSNPPRTAAEKEKAEQTVNMLGEEARKIRGAIQWVQTAPWYSEVGEYQATAHFHVMNSDPRYRALNQLFREMQSEQSRQNDQNYSYQWKRTDKLYEIWGYIQFIKTLARDELGFTPESGWIYSVNPAEDGGLVPELPANTEVVFRKDNIRISLVYEALLPTQSKLTTRESPLYTRGTHTCPDGRLDVFMDEIFIGTIIFDFKYRPRSAIWDQTKIQSNQQTGVMMQLVSYGDNPHSPYLYGARGDHLFSHNSPVQEVWAIYPNRYGTANTHEYPDHKLSLIGLTPGGENTHFAERLKASLERIFEKGSMILDLLGKMGV